MEVIYIKSLKFIIYYIVIIIMSYIIDNFIYVGVIDNPALFISIIPIVIIVHLFLNNKKSTIMNNINKIILIGMILVFIVAIPKYSYKASIEKVLSTRFQNESVTVVDIEHKSKKIKTMEKLPFFMDNFFYRVKVEDSRGTILNFYINPETGEWVEK